MNNVVSFLTEDALMKRIKKYLKLLSLTFKKWLDRDPFRNSTIIAYYTVFSLPGLLIIIISLVGYFYGADNVSERIQTQVQGIIGAQAAKDIESIVLTASMQKGSTLSYLLSIATILFGATGVFYQVQQSFNIIWEVKPKPRGKLLKLIKDRLFSFGLVLAIGFLLLVSLVLSALLSALSSWVTNHFSESLTILFKVLDIGLSLSVIIILFASIFKILPDAEIKWRNVWPGAIITSLLFVLAKFLLGLYFGYSDPGSLYGAAGSLVLILLWVSYAGVILLFGAEFTQVYTHHQLHERTKPMEHAVSTKQTINDKNDKLKFSSRLSLSKKNEKL